MVRKSTITILTEEVLQYTLWQNYSARKLSNCVVHGVTTSLVYAKCNILKLRKVCEQSELRLQNIDPLKRGEF